MIKRTVNIIIRLTAFVVASFLFVSITLLFASAMTTSNHPDLQWWHSEKISSEFSARDLSTVSTFEQYLTTEHAVFDEVRSLVTSNAQSLEPRFLNRYQQGNESNPYKPGGNLNRSSQHQPAVIKGGVLLLHGMTDSPYSLRHLAAMFKANGFYVLNMRMPGHGTIPAELGRVQWQDWLAAVKLGASHVAQQIGPQKPFYMLGYSNGGSLALKYSMDSLGEDGLRTPDHVFLLSPMIGVSSMAGFSRLFYWLGRLDFFSHFRWLDVYPEYDPHKYNSFPMNAGLQSYKLTTTIKEQLDRMAPDGGLDLMPPVMTFQSLVDSTVISSAVVDDLYEKLPGNGSELVLFDVNNLGELDEFVLPKHKLLLNRAMKEGSGKYAVSVITNRLENDPMVVELRQAAGVPGYVNRGLPFAWPEDVYSLSHVALPFPMDDEIYGLEYEGVDSEYPNFGRVQILGESGTLILPPALLQRIRSNPFYGYIEERIGSVIQQDPQNSPVTHDLN